MISTNTTYNVLAPAPFDGRLKVSTYAELAQIPIKFIGLTTYVEDEDTDYRYKAGGWVTLSYGSGGGGAVWGDITGAIGNQVDLNVALGLKFDKTGGTVTGSILCLGTVEANNHVLVGSTESSEMGTYLNVVSVPTSITASGSPNQVAFDSDYIYICIAINTWMRAPLSSWV